MPNYIYNLSSVQLLNNTYSNTALNSIDLQNTSWVNNSATNAFSNCRNLTSIINMNGNITDLINTYSNCISLVNIPNISNTVINLTNAFVNCHSLIDAPNIPNSITNMSGAFAYCNNLINIPTIPNGVTDISRTFMNCTNLVNMPIIPNTIVTMNLAFANCESLNNIQSIPNSVLDITCCFYNCTNLTNTPNIPDSITNLFETFKNCSNIISTPTIPNSIYDMTGSFAGCSNLTNVLSIPESVSILTNTFADCVNLTNDIHIQSYLITEANGCFYNTSANKNVYIDYYIPYTNQESTLTKNSFTSAGYDENGTLHGVYLKNETPTLFINTIPADATVNLTINGITISEHTLSIPINSIVNWTVSKEEYISQSNSVILNEDKHIDVILQVVLYELNVIPVPNNAMVKLEAIGYETVEGIGSQSIYVPKNTQVTYTISKENYITKTDTFTVTENNSIAIELDQSYNFTLDQNNEATLVHYNDPEEVVIISDVVSGTESYILTVNTTPADANVSFTVTGDYQQINDNSIIVKSNTLVQYTVSKTGYITQSNSIYVDHNITVNVNLGSITLTIVPIPTDADVILTATGYTQHENSIDVIPGTSITYIVSKQGYPTRSDTIILNTDLTLSVDLNPRNMLNVEDYNYTTTVTDDISLTQYIGTNSQVVVPVIEEI